jgi:hypothetical protein
VYATANPFENAVVEAQYDRANYENYEVTLDMAALLGDYYLEIAATDALYTTKTLTTEFFNVKAAQEGLIAIKYWNADNAYGVDYTTGLEHLVRIEGRMWEFVPGREDTVYENDQASLTKLKSVVQKNKRLEFWHLPQYLVEKIQLIASMDYIEILGVQWQTEEGLEVAHSRLMPLVSGSLVLRQVDYEQYNSNDISGTARLETVLCETTEPEPTISEGVMKEYKIKVPSAKLLTCGTVPVDILLGSGANKINAISHIMVQENVSGGYSQDAILKVSGGAVPLAIIPLQNTANKYTKILVDYEANSFNLALQLTTLSGTDPTLGTNDLYLTIYYTQTEWTNFITV